MRAGQIRSNPTYLQRLTSFYGTTTDPMHGGFILPSGSFLDLGYGTQKLAYDHTHIRWVLSGVPRSAHEDMVRVAIRAGLHKWSPDSWSAEVWTEPTSAQLDRLASLAMVRPITVHCWRPGLSSSWTYSASDVRRMRSDLSSFFSGSSQAAQKYSRPANTMFAAAHLLGLLEDASVSAFAGMVRVSSVAETSGMRPELFRDTLVRLDREGIIELRPESAVPSGAINVSDLDEDHLPWYPLSPSGVPLTWVRLRDPLAPNPKWADLAFEQEWSFITEFARERGLPLPLSKRRGATLTYRQHGCGAWGCVFPTDDPSVVVKLTADPSELYFAELVTYYMNVPYDEGFVRYYAAVPTSASVRSLPLTLIWREAAHQIGGLHQLADVDEHHRVLLSRLEDLVWFGNGIRHSVDRNAQDRYVFLMNVSGAMPNAKALLSGRHLASLTEPPPLVKPLRPFHWTRPYDEVVDTAVNAYAYWKIAKTIESEGGAGLYIGRILAELASYGVFLTDPHPGNIGLVFRENYQSWVITDPGGIAVLSADLPAQPKQPYPPL